MQLSAAFLLLDPSRPLSSSLCRLPSPIPSAFATLHSDVRVWLWNCVWIPLHTVAAWLLQQGSYLFPFPGERFKISFGRVLFAGSCLSKFFFSVVVGGIYAKLTALIGP